MTICGVVIEAGDWPEGCPSFAVIDAMPHFEPDGMYSFPLTWFSAESRVRERYAMWLPIIAATFRCWHLDRAEEAWRAMVKISDEYDTDRDLIPDDEREYKRLEEMQNAAERSAAKWAQIGRNACKR